MITRFKVKQAAGGHFYLEDSKGVDVLKSNGYTSKKLLVDAAKEVLKKGEEYKGAVIKSSKKTAEGFEIET
jgi:hypothetical protein